MEKPNQSKSYWNDNLLAVSVLLVIWFLVAYVCGIFGIDWLNGFRVGNVGLGFWIAQQGSIFVFVLIVLVYALWMDRLDRKHGLGDDR